MNGVKCVQKKSPQLHPSWTQKRASVQVCDSHSPRTVMVHFEDTLSADRAVVAPVRLDGLALVTVTNGTLLGPLNHGKLHLDHKQLKEVFPILLRLGCRQPLQHLTEWDEKCG